MTGRHGEGFTRSARIRCRREFLSLGRSGERRVSGHFVFIVQKSSNPVRLGITVSRKVGGAVVRNLLKRRVRESFRRHPMRSRLTGDLLVIARAGVGAVAGGVVAREVGAVMEMMGRRQTGSR
ncbi:MAG: ribonuclease P protein component [Dehalococcoidia bacterium]|nr:ribonuclease P protein component [Dehalococcoidia bacterium]